MNRNLKKVISSVVALALSLGSLSAFAASGYSDVAETANYATAVNELSALGIVNGYEDGTFQPDKKVSRAEVTKMIVAALAQTAAADAAKGATAYSDVTADHWASGFINVGSSTSGFINGMGDGTFAPESNVTYAQLVKMLVSALGYGGMALQEGGYPTGYITVGDRIGVTKSVVANANDELTRGQVAVLIDNSINLPLLVTTVWSAANPEYEIKDGKGKDFQSLLTEYHDVYKVEGKITGTSRSETGLDPDEAKFEIAVADRFDDDDYYLRTEDRNDREQTVIVADGIDATGELFAYATALIHKNDDDEYELISLNSTAKSKTVTLPAGGFDFENNKYSSYVGASDEEKAADAISEYEVLRYYANDSKTGKISDYKLAGSTTNTEDVPAQLWVNGVKIGDLEDSLGYIRTALVENKVGTVTLVDAPQEGKATTDGYYDYVLVSYYESAIVDSVAANGTVYLTSSQTKDRTYASDASTGLGTNIKFDQSKVEDGDLTYTITLDGKEIEFTDLQEDDVISVAYDITEGVKNSEFYDVIVTRGTVEGKVNEFDEEDEEYVVNGTTYKFSQNTLNDGYNNDILGTEATLYVDAFGRVVKLEETATSKKYAIAENVWYEDGPQAWYAKIVLPDGTVKDVEIKETNSTALADLQKAVFVNGTNGTKKDIQNRVITYKINSSEQIYQATNVAPKASGASEEYKERNAKVGDLKVSSNAVIIDASDYEGKVADLKTVSKLIDETEYTAYGYDKLSSDSSYSFIIITEGIGGYSDDTQMAVVVKTTSTTNKDDDAKPQLTLLYNGEQKPFIVDEYNGGNITSDDEALALNKGDVITFQLNNDNEIKRIDLVGDLNIANKTKIRTFAPTKANGSIDFSAISFSTTAMDLDEAAMNDAEKLIGKWNASNADSDVNLKFGVITDKSSNTVYVTPYGGTNADEEDFTIESDTKIYVIDFSADDKAVEIGNSSSVIKTSISDNYKVKDGKDTTDDINWEAIEEDPDMFASLNYAFMRVDDDEIREIFVILAPGEAGK